MKKKAYTTKKQKTGPESNSIVILFIYIKKKPLILYQR